MILLIVLGSLIIGFIVGATSLGGFLLVPLLVLYSSVSPPESIVIALLSFIPSGFIGAWIYYRRNLIHWRMLVTLTLSNLPGLYLGLKWSYTISERMAQQILGGFLFFISLLLLYQVYRMRNNKRNNREYPSKIQPKLLCLEIMLGFIAGISSTLAGVGGALIFVPVVVALGLAPGVAVGTGIATSTGLALFGATGHLFNLGSLHYGLAAIVVIAVSLGTFVGSKIAHHVPRLWMMIIIILLCIAAGLNLTI